MSQERRVKGARSELRQGQWEGTKVHRCAAKRVQGVREKRRAASGSREPGMWLQKANQPTYQSGAWHMPTPLAPLRQSSPSRCAFKPLVFLRPGFYARPPCQGLGTRPFSFAPVTPSRQPYQSVCALEPTPVCPHPGLYACPASLGLKECPTLLKSLTSASRRPYPLLRAFKRAPASPQPRIICRPYQSGSGYMPVL